ncbi:MAG: hypothetical protein HQL13_04060 [Candidatus Omnitrophica bacterium]|nr:hypothetical protein [Candidatus Omnitrophota bacterium]
MKFNFLVDPGDTSWKADKEHLKNSCAKLIKYFMAALTVKDEDMWVNLSPYEKARIIPLAFSTTDMGRDLLAEDYVLKQISSSLLYPNSPTGKTFWNTIYTKTALTYGTTDIKVKTFHKIWIVPDKAVVYEHLGSAFIGKSHLKVLLEQDYLAQKHNLPSYSKGNRTDEDVNKSSAKDILSTSIMRDVLVPVIEKEVNEGKHFALLRQSYNSIILATWYKKRLKESLLGQIYIGKNKVNGIDIEDKNIRQKIYTQYLKAFKKGVFNFIKEDIDVTRHETIPRKYFSGGTEFTARAMTAAMTTLPMTHDSLANSAQTTYLDEPVTVVPTNAMIGTIPPVVAKPEGVSVPQSELYDYYWGNYSTPFRAIIDKAKELAANIAAGRTTVEERENEIKDIAKKILKDAAPHFKKGANNTAIDQKLQEFINAIDAGSKQLFCAIAINAWIGEDMINHGNGQFETLNFPRDGGLWHTGLMAQALLSDTDLHPALFYLSGNNLTFKPYYSQMQSFIATAKNSTSNKNDFLKKLGNLIKDKMESDADFKAKMERIQKDLEANLKKSGAFDTKKIRYADTGWGTFPLMFEALTKIWWPDIQVTALVQASGHTAILDQLNPDNWAEGVRNAIMASPAGAFAVPNFHHSENIFSHPIQGQDYGVPIGDEFNETLKTTDETRQCEAVWHQLCFVLGAIKYDDLVTGIIEDLTKSNITPKKAETIAHDAIRDSLNIVTVDDKSTGLTTSVQVTLVQPKHKPEYKIKETVALPGEQPPVAKKPQDQKDVSDSYVEPALTSAGVFNNILESASKAANLHQIAWSVNTLTLVDAFAKAKVEGIDTPAVEEHNKKVDEKKKEEEKKQTPPATPPPAPVTVTLFNADPVVKNMTDYTASEWFNKDLTQRKWYSPVKWFLGMIEAARVALHAKDRRTKLHTLINTGAALDAGNRSELGLNHDEEFTSSENGVLASIASRNFEQTGEIVTPIGDADPIVQNIKSLFHQYITTTMTDNDFEAQVRAITGQIRAAHSDIASIGSNLLKKAKELKRAFSASGHNLKTLQPSDINLNVNFVANLKHAFVAAPKPQGWWNQTIVNIIDGMQSRPALKLPILGFLTSPTFVAVTMSITGQAVAASSRWAVKTAAVAGMAGILFPVLGTASLIALGVSVVLTGVVAAMRENARVSKNLTLLEIRQSLDLESEHQTKQERKLINGHAVTEKVSVKEAITNLRTLTSQVPTDTAKRDELTAAAADVMARLEYGSTVGVEFLRYDSDRFIQQETQRTQLSDALQGALTALGMSRANIIAHPSYSEAENALKENYTQSLQNFRKVKRGEVFWASFWSMVFAAGFSYASGVLFHWISGLLHHNAPPAAPNAPAHESTTPALSQHPVETTRTIHFSTLADLLTQNANKVQPNDVREALFNPHNGIQYPDEVMRELVKDGKVDVPAVVRRITNGSDRKLADALANLLHKQLGIELHLSGWSKPAFIHELWTPQMEHKLQQAGIQNVHDFKIQFEHQLMVQGHGAWSHYDTLLDILKTNRLAKKAETIILEELSRHGSQTQYNLDDFMRQAGFLRTKDSVQHFFEPQNGDASLLERYRNYVTDPKTYNTFVQHIRRIYDHRGPSPDWGKIGHQIQVELDKLPTADRNTIIFDIIHRYKEWAPGAESGHGHNSFLDIFAETHRSADHIKMDIKVITPVTPPVATHPAPEPIVAPPVIEPPRLGPAVTINRLPSLGLLKEKEQTSTEEPIEDAPPLTPVTAQPPAPPSPAAPGPISDTSENVVPSPLAEVSPVVPQSFLLLRQENQPQQLALPAFSQSTLSEILVSKKLPDGLDKDNVIAELKTMGHEVKSDHFEKGGIDMSMKNVKVEIQGDGSIHFTISKALLAQFKNARGLMPETGPIVLVKDLIAYFEMTPSSASSRPGLLTSR